MDALAPAFTRGTWLAKTLFDAFDASISLIDGERIWRSRDHDDVPVADPCGEMIIASGEPLWIEDALADPAWADNPLVTGPFKIRFYAGAPIKLADGSTPGVLCVVDRDPRPYDPVLAKGLRELAASVADECERARTAEAAAASAAQLDGARALLSAFVRSVPVSLVMMDREFRVLKASPRWLESFEIQAHEAEGRSIFQIDPYYERFRGAYEKVLSGRTLRDPKVLADHHGRRNWISSDLTPWRDDKGEIGGIIVSAHIITEMVEALERMERSEQRLKLALDVADVYVYDIDYVTETMEKAGAEETFFERPLTFAENKAADGMAMVHPDHRERVKRERRESYFTTGVATAEFPLNLPDREVWAATATNVHMDDKGNVARLVGAMRNITSHKLAERDLLLAKEEAEAANHAKSAFLATMSHEIRTPLNGVLGMAQVMAAEELSETQRERLAVIRQSGETLLAILNDVLDLSKIEAGKLELEEAEFDIGELARGAHGAFTAIAHKKGLSFDLVVEQTARGVYRGDSTRVRQILYNLVSNALKFTHEGEVRVGVSGGRTGLSIRVSDTGIGISPERLAGLFEKFEQADASTTRRYGGTGLGLAICRELAGLMGGKIDATSEPNRGTVFTVELPLPRIGDEGERSSPVTEAHAASQLEGPAIRVLAAEDNTVNQLVLKTLLAQAGLEPVVVENGKLAFEAWEAGSWDVILMDVQMPEMDGPTATRLIREKEAESGRARTPIIALTANAMSHQVAEYLAAGMDGFVPKPIEVGRLFAVLQQTLDEAENGKKAEAA